MNKLTQSFSLCALFLVVSLINFTSCEDQIVCSFEEDQNIITTYLSSNNITATKTDSGLHYQIQEEGKGSLTPTVNSQVTVKYKGYFTDGTVFDESTTGTKFVVGNVIQGWQEGLALMKKESKAQFFIPSSIAYGSRLVGGIVGTECSVIIFDVELMDFN